MNTKLPVPKMMPTVLRPAEYLKVFNTVVELVLISMMNNLRAFQLTTEKFLHDCSMLKVTNAATVGETSIPLEGNRPFTRAQSSLAVATVLASARTVSLFQPLCLATFTSSNKLLPALRTEFHMPLSITCYSDGNFAGATA